MMTPKTSFQMISFMDRSGFRVMTLILLFLSLVLGIKANDNSLFPPKPEPAVFVHDYSNWLTVGQKNALEMRLRAYYDSTSTQIIVMIRSDIGDYDLSSYSFELGERWGVGEAGKDNGIVMTVKTSAPNRGVFIATGYGTEEFLTDSRAKRIIETIILPRFRQGQNFDGIQKGIEGIQQVLAGQFQNVPRSTDEEIPVIFIVLLIIMIIIILIIINNSGRMHTGGGSYDTGLPGRNHRGSSWGTGGTWGGPWGGGSFGGGFGGGGGSSWGGGFGGGSFGGGGAGGSW